MSIRAMIVPVVTLAVAGGLFFTIDGCWTSWEGGHAEQRTNDAYVRADLTPLSTRISGTVRKMEVNDYEAVQPGQLLVQLEDQDYAAVLAEDRAALAGAEAQLEDNQSAKKIQDSKIENAETGVVQATAALNSAKAGVAAVRPEVERTELERKREQALLASKATTHQELEGAVANADQYAGLLESRQADLAKAQGALDSSLSTVEAAKRERAALDTKDAVYRADIKAKQAAIVVAEVNLAYTRIVAPTAGAVGERHVFEGQLVAPGQQVLDLVKGDVWIQANYQETQLTHMQKGDVADITIDTFPGVVLHGKVAEISPASGSQFALLPPDNATGNFTKVVQRIPVKIVLDGDPSLGDLLRPGMSVIATIDTSSPAVTSKPSPH
jgi:membrane fusion protein, multidrug efflux system